MAKQDKSEAKVIKLNEKVTVKIKQDYKIFKAGENLLIHPIQAEWLIKEKIAELV